MNKEDIKIIVASGGLEVYDPKPEDDIFIFKSSYHKALKNRVVVELDAIEEVIKETIRVAREKT